MAMDEALVALEEAGPASRHAARTRLPVRGRGRRTFIDAHEQVFVIEQNRDAQLQMLMVNECAIDPARFISILHYDGTPITARFITGAIAERMNMASRKHAAE